MNAIITLLSIGVATCIASRAWGDIIFNVDFEDPPHTVGSQTANGPPPSYVTLFGYGVADVSEFGSQGARTTASGTDSLMLFDSGTTYTSGIHSISWDWIQYAYSTSIPGGVDSAVNIGPGQFHVPHDNGYLGLSQAGVLEYPFVGTYSTGVVYNYALLIDIDGYAYDFAINGTTVVDGGTLSNTVSLSSVTFYNPWGSDHAVDNFRWEIVPEPSTLLLISLGVLAVCGRLRALRLQQTCSKTLAHRMP